MQLFIRDRGHIVGMGLHLRLLPLRAQELVHLRFLRLRAQELDVIFFYAIYTLLFTKEKDGHSPAAQIVSG